ncbi:MAG: hypothetical protein ACRD0V_09220 [Acidimicrobiales bacterium]
MLLGNVLRMLLKLKVAEKVAGWLTARRRGRYRHYDGYRPPDTPPGRDTPGPPRA